MTLTALVLLLIGLIAGVLAGLFGIGGGLVIVPALTALLVFQGIEAHVAVTIAVASSLASMLLTAVSAVWFHHRRGIVDWAAIVRIAPAMTIGAALGAWAAMSVSGEIVARVFALVAAVTGTRMILARATRVAARQPRPRLWWLAGPPIGAVSAMVGIGGGTFNVPWLARNGYEMVRAVAIASACGWPIALGGAAMFALAETGPDMPEGMLGFLWWPGAVVIGLGGLAAAPAGVALAHRLSSTGLRRLFGVVLILVAVRMAW
ncbi:MAG: sulfite exporter TauE/SafE family protein [Wenzhouxiangella sp.]